MSRNLFVFVKSALFLGIFGLSLGVVLQKTVGASDVPDGSGEFEVFDGVDGCPHLHTPYICDSMEEIGQVSLSSQGVQIDRRFYYLSEDMRVMETRVVDTGMLYRLSKPGTTPLLGPWIVVQNRRDLPPRATGSFRLGSCELKNDNGVQIEIAKNFIINADNGVDWEIVLERNLKTQGITIAFWKPNMSSDQAIGHGVYVGDRAAPMSEIERLLREKWDPLKSGSDVRRYGSLNCTPYTVYPKSKL